MAKRKTAEAANKENPIENNKKTKSEPETKESAQAPSSSDKAVDQWIPSVAVDFYEKYGMLESIKNVKNARFAGPFQVLSGENTSSGLDIMMIDRQALDLPEMQTFLIFDGGRYAFWRDEPKQKNVLVVYCNDADIFPDIKVVGNLVEHAILHLCSEKKEKTEQILGVFDENWKNDVKSIQKQRKKDKIGDAPHDVGIWVKMKDNVGYRSLMESSKNMRKILIAIKNTENDSVIPKQIAVLDEEFRHVQIAFDESDFGMGLEYGHWLFLANSKKVSTLSLFSLKLAYSFLGREDFFKIVRQTVDTREISA